MEELPMQSQTLKLEVQLLRAKVKVRHQLQPERKAIVQPQHQKPQ